MTVVRMTDWSVVHGDDPYLAPEVAVRHLMGKAEGHPFKPNGKLVRSSPIAKINGRIITTESGRIYELVGPPEAGHMAHIKEIGAAYDDAEPVKIKEMP